MKKHLQSSASNLKASPTGGGWRGLLLLLFIIPSLLYAQTDSTAVPPLQGEVGRGLPVRHIGEVVVTGSRATTDLRHLPMTLTVVGSETLREHERPNLMTTVAEQVPGLFLTQRGMMGYGVSGGGSGALSMRGMAGGSGRMMVLVDGHPQYNGIYGHPSAALFLCCCVWDGVRS